MEAVDDNSKANAIRTSRYRVRQTGRSSRCGWSRYRGKTRLISKPRIQKPTTSARPKIAIPMAPGLLFNLS